AAQRSKRPPARLLRCAACAARTERLRLRMIAMMILSAALAAEPDGAALARQAHDILKANCYRCHGQDGAVEGGMNYVLDLKTLLARKKVVPGSPENSPLYNKVANGKMPPPDEKPRPSAADLTVLKQWIEAGAPAATPAT